MSVRSKYRGHAIVCIGGEWYYEESMQSVNSKPDVSCSYCGLESTKEGHDGCLGTLRGVMNACCGHGIDEEAYIQFLDGKKVEGEDAKVIQKILMKNNNHIRHGGKNELVKEKIY